LQKRHVVTCLRFTNATKRAEHMICICMFHLTVENGIEAPTRKAWGQEKPEENSCE
jgi:hypothetical protein